MKGERNGRNYRRSVVYAGQMFVSLVAILSILMNGIQIASADPAGTALQFNGTNQYVTFGDTSLVRGTLSGTTTPTWNLAANSKLGNSSLSFNGSTAYVTTAVGTDLNTEIFTVETWFYRTGAGVGITTGSGGIASAIPLVTKGTSESETATADINYFLGIDATSAKLVADFEEGAGGASPSLNHPIVGTTVIALNTWYHAAATYDGNKWQLFLNGNLEGELIVGRPANAGVVSPMAMGTSIRSNGTTIQGYFAGRLDEVRIWNVVRSQTEIQASMNSEILAPTSGLLGRWGLNDGSGTTASNLNRLGATAYTLEAWVKRAAGGATMTTGTAGFDGAGGRPNGIYPVVSKGMGEGETPANINTNYILGITADGYVGADFEDTNGGVNHPAWGTTPISIGAWHSIAATYTGSCWAIYVDGVPDTLNALVTACPNATPESTSYQRAGLAGALNSTGGLATGYFSGVIDEARVWNRALAPAEILANQFLELTSGSGLIARWGLNEGSGSAVNDSATPTAENGTAMNGPTWVSGFPIPDSTTPAAPTGLAAAPHSGAVSLSWTAPDDPDVAGYNVYRSTTSPVPLSGPVNGGTLVTATSYTDNGLTNGTPYYYVVTAVDTSTNQSAASNEVSATPQASLGTGLGFDGTNDYVTFGAASGLGVKTFTIETWFKRTGTGATTYTGSGGAVAVPLVTKGMAENDALPVDMNYFLGIESGTNFLVADFEECDPATQTPDCLAGGTAGLNHPVKGATAVQNNVWYHASVSYDGRYFKIYLNGNLDGQLDVGAIRYPRWDSTQHAAIGTALQSSGSPGSSSGYGPGYFAGVIDETRIWNVARTQAEIRSTINIEVTSGAGLIGRWGMNEGSGSFIYSSVGSFPGTLNNGPLWTAGAPFDIVFDTTPPAAPTGLSATPSNAIVSLDWANNAEADLAGYNVYRGTTSGVYAKVNASLVTASNYMDSGLTNGTEYYYIVRAVDASNNESLDSNEAYAIPQIEAGSALEFTTSSGTYVTFGDPDKLDLATFTIETWFKRTGNGTSITTGNSGIPQAVPLVTHGAQQSEGSTVDANWVLVIDDATDVIAADFEDMATGLNHPVLGVTPITNNVWHHAAATFDGTYWKLYLDGKLETSLSVAGYVPRSDTTQHAGLGSMLNTSGGTNGFFQGVLDEARVWNRALTQAEILATINHQITNGSGLVARWGLNEGGGTVVGDSVVPSVNGTITGANYAWVPGAPFNLNITPDTPTPTYPANGATGVTTPANLTVHVSDPLNSSLTVSFYGRVKNGPAGADFSLIAIPDPQYYAATYPAIYNAQMDWVVANKTGSNIKYVMSLGDNVDDRNVSTQWTRATAAWNILTSGSVPYGLTLGNHDGAPSDTTNFNANFGALLSSQPTYGGRPTGATDYDNTYATFSSNGMDFIVLFIEYDTTMTSASNPILVWANSVLAANPTKRAIVVTHDLLDSNSNFTSQGAAIYNALKGNANLFLLMGGHLDGSKQRTDVYNGHIVYSLRSDYQFVDSQQSGYLRILRFSPANNQIYVTTYSPNQNKYLTDTTNQFSLPYSMDGVADFTFIGSTTVPSGSDASVAWSGLAAGVEYEWYAVVDNGGSASANSPTWSFTISSPTGVILSNFSAAPAANQVSISWQTLLEVNTSGFNVFRSTSEGGARTRLNTELIPAETAGQMTGSSYTFLDRAVQPGRVYYYWLQSMDSSGLTTDYGPLQVTAPHVVFLPILRR